MGISRRCFLTGAAAVTAGCATLKGGASHDETLVALVSDCT